MKTVIVAGLIIKDNKLLCIKQDKGVYKDFIWLPAGHLEPNESLEEAVVREVKEEVGFDVKPKKLIMKTELKPFTCYFYLCEVIGGKLSLEGEIKEAFWLTFEEILQLEKVHPFLYALASLSIHHPEIYEGI